MTTAEKSSQTSSPPTAHGDQEVTLLDQIRWVVAGHHVDDVMTIAAMLLMEGAVQSTPDKDAAFEYLFQVFWGCLGEIDHDYANLKGATTGVLHGQTS